MLTMKYLFVFKKRNYSKDHHSVLQKKKNKNTNNNTYGRQRGAHVYILLGNFFSRILYSEAPCPLNVMFFFYLWMVFKKDRQLSHLNQFLSVRNRYEQNATESYAYSYTCNYYQLNLKARLSSYVHKSPIL